jgi:hypothetical protein
MNKRHLIAMALLAGASLAQAELVKLEIKERSDVLNGKAFGNMGAYERIVGRAYFAVDPKIKYNQAIADITLAPKNGAGRVEFSSDFYMFRPKDPKKGNGTVLYEVSNRGAKSMLGHFNRATLPEQTAAARQFQAAAQATPLDPRAPEQFGDGMLMEEGYTALWLGWQFDMPEQEGLVRLYPPVIPGLKGTVRAEMTPDARVPKYSVADRNHKPYVVLNPDDPTLKLTVRDEVEGPRTTIARADWHIENGTDIVLKGGFDPGRIYEMVYTSENPPVAGTGFAAVRDFIAWMKYGGTVQDAPMPAAVMQRAYGFGVSQSGRFLRTGLYFGFNRDEKGRKVFDGLLVDVAGGGRGGFNMRFSQPSRDSNPFYNTLTPVDLFPFTDLEQTDPATGQKDGLLTHSLPREFWPKIFYMNSEYEYYGRAASLVTITLDGKADAALAPSSRVYMFAGGQHGPANFPPVKRGTQNLPNPNPYTYIFRAMLHNMDAWVKDGKEPPASKYPSVAKGELVPIDQVKYAKIPGVNTPIKPHYAYPSNFGPEFRTKGIASQEPPEIGKPYPMLLPQVDADGNDVGGIHMPQIAVPVATYTGWNLRAPEIGAPTQLSTQIGSFIPFARTKAEREKSGDPRPSIEERYQGKDDYLKKFEAAARQLVKDGFLLERDIPALLQRGSAEWDFVMNGGSAKAMGAGQ